jgi:hypothetical protein
VKKFSSAIAILMLMLFMVLASANNVRAQPYPLNSMWVSPPTIAYSTNNASVGTLFNITVWANMQNSTYDWEVNMTFAASVFQEVACGYTNGATSAYFTGHTTVPVAPVVDNVVGTILFGESLIGATDYVAEENASLVYAEFNITQMPTTSTPITGLFDINSTGTAGTFFDDTTGTTINDASNLYDASFTLSYVALPTISSVTQVPGTTHVNDSQSVIVSANVTDTSGTGIANVTVVYTTAYGWVANYTAPMTLNATTGLYDGTILGHAGGTVVSYVIQAYDNGGGFTESSPYQTYTVIPEYAVVSLMLIMIAMLAVAITIARKKHAK